MTSINLDRVVIDLPIYNSRGRSLKSAILSHAVGGRLVDDTDRSVVVIRALNEISLQLEHGERLALIGPNGAGKTTLLRVMGRIYPPTSGNADITGHIACLTDLAVGLDMEATGYENIAMRGVLHGLSHAESAKLIPDIEEFTELGQYLSLPIRTYSLGMLLRLSFGISTAIRPDIVLLDEIIGVGDQVFAVKARQRLLNLIEDASILVLASHDPSILKTFCTTAAWLEKGRIVEVGPIDEVAEHYAASARPS